jgi:hypothetical protein
MKLLPLLSAIAVRKGLYLRKGRAAHNPGHHPTDSVSRENRAKGKPPAPGGAGGRKLNSFWLEVKRQLPFEFAG